MGPGIEKAHVEAGGKVDCVASQGRHGRCQPESARNRVNWESAHYPRSGRAASLCPAYTQHNKGSRWVTEAAGWWLWGEAGL